MCTVNQVTLAQWASIQCLGLTIHKGIVVDRVVTRCQEDVALLERAIPGVQPDFVNKFGGDRVYAMMRTLQ